MSEIKQNIHTIKLTDIKEPDKFNELLYRLDIPKELRDEYFEFAEYIDLELAFDDELNIVNAKVLEKG